MKNTHVFLFYASLLPILLSINTGWIRDLFLYLHALGAGLILFLLITASSASGNELYGQKHFIFNLELPPRTLWFNMGLWDNEGFTYPEACENLVRTVANNMDLKKGSDVLDVGFGCGDSCILLSEQFGCNVTGITNELTQWQLANARLTSTQKTKINLLHGSADHLEEPLTTSTTSTAVPVQFDHIISIDSAYHYNTRWTFFKEAYQKLKIGGTLGLYDLVIDDGLNRDSAWMNIACRVLHVPKANLVTVTEYRQRLEAMGFDHVEVTAIDRKRVFGGLVQFFKRRALDVTDLGTSNILFLKISIWLFGKLAKNPWAVPVLVKADKSKKKEEKA